MSTEGPQNIATAISDVTDRATLLVREEIELAKLEITQKITRLAKGAAVGIVAGVFVIAGLFMLLDGFAWLSWWALPVDNQQFFWGFFFMAGLLFVLGGLAGFLAARWIKRSAPPTPELAIDEAKKIKETVEHGVGHDHGAEV